MATATVQIEHYRQPIDPPVHSMVTQTAEAQEMYRRAGLAKLAGAYSGHVEAQTRLTSADMLYGRLSSGDLSVWQRYLPKPYRLEAYSYDIPPQEVALAIADAQEMKIFDRIEIWTSEESGIMERTRKFYHDTAFKVHSMLDTVVDPMAVGVIEHAGVAYYFPVVRWGEALHSFARIKATVRARSTMVFAMTTLPLILLVLVVLGLLVWGFIATWAALGAWAIAAWIVGAFFLIMFIDAFMT